MKATHYSARSATFFSIPNADAETTGWNSVVINLQGDFYNATQAAFALPSGGLSIAGRKGIGAFILLHELGHQLDEYTHFIDDSSGSDATEGPNNQFVYDNCFAP